MRSLSPAKLAVIGLAGVLAVAGGGLLLQPDAPLTPLQRRVEEPLRPRGDDPTYADELKKMAALLQDVSYRFKESENQRLIERNQTEALVRAETQRAIQQARQENERLSQALREAGEALNQKIQAAADAPAIQQLRADIARLTTEQETLRQRPAETPAAAGPVDGPPAPPRPEANRVTAAPAAPVPAPSTEATPGPLQVLPGVLDPLRSLNLDGLADGLTDPATAETAGVASRIGKAGPGRRASKTAAGLGDDYVTLTPYVAGGGSGPVYARAAPSAPGTDGRLSLAPRRYPFTVKAGEDGASAVLPVYTLPDAATLVHNATMTPLVGRVPFRGALRDPFRFKLITGATNLASNGHRIPGVANAVWTGYAVGVREQSCVRAYIDTVTFTFQDGRLHTVRKGKGHTATATTASVNDNLGYLTDRWGKPCIRGRYFNNAGRYLQSRSLAAFLDGLASAYANSQTTTERVDGVLSSYVSGNTYQYALGKGVSGTADEIADYLRERAEDAFDVVYVPPGIDVQIFVEAEIPIDYATHGRKLRYDYGSEVSHVALD